MSRLQLLRSDRPGKRGACLFAVGNLAHSLVNFQRSKKNWEKRRRESIFPKSRRALRAPPKLLTEYDHRFDYCARQNRLHRRCHSVQTAQFNAQHGRVVVRFPVAAAVLPQLIDNYCSAYTPIGYMVSLIHHRRFGNLRPIGAIFPEFRRCLGKWRPVAVFSQVSGRRAPSSAPNVHQTDKSFHFPEIYSIHALLRALPKGHVHIMV